MPPKVAAAPEGAVRFGRMKSTLKMGIVGLPNVGKSSLFNLLTKTHIAECGNRPFCTIDPNEARCPVPDERYDHLCSIWNPPSKYPAFLQVWDIAGLIKGASTGAGLGNKFLSHIGEVDGIYHVVRAFDDEEVQHVEDSVDPVRDLDTIIGELCRKDLQLLESAMTQEERDVKKTGGTMKISLLYSSTMSRIKDMLERNLMVKDGEWSTPEIELIKEKLPGLVTTKPQIYIVNLSKHDFLRKKNKWLLPIHKYVTSHGGGTIIPLSVDWEEELAALVATGDAAAVAAFCAPPEGVVGAAAQKSVLPKAIAEGFSVLELIFFMTAGDTEVRCWPIQKGWLAPQAAGVIHTDFEKYFIKAEVCSYDDFKALQGNTKGMNEVRAAGKYRIEGKSYVMQDGDIVYFQIGQGKK